MPGTLEQTEHGLGDSHLRTLKSILRACPEAIERVGIFGSRATGAYKSNSDIDLVLYGEIGAGSVDRLWTLFHESNLPYKVDVTAYNLIRYKPLKRHIDNIGKILFTKTQLGSTDEQPAESRRPARPASP